MNFLHHSYCPYLENVSFNSPIPCPKELISSSVAGWTMENGTFLRDVSPNTSSSNYFGIWINSKNHFLKSLLSSHFFLKLMLMLNFFVVYPTLFSSHHSNQPTLHKKWSFPLRISSFLCSVNIKIRQAMTPFHRISVGMTNCWFCSNNFVQIMMKNIRLLWTLRFVFFLSLPPSVYKSIWNGIFYGP